MEPMTIRKLVEGILNGQIRIPAFQREFVWEPDRVALFIDSIYKDYPFGSLLFSTDAYGLAELYYLGALLFRKAFDGVVDPFVAAGEMAERDADRLAALVARDTASRVYGL